MSREFAEQVGYADNTGGPLTVTATTPTHKMTFEQPLPGTQVVEDEIEQRTKAFEQIVDNYSTNRKSRRQFKKHFGVMPPAKHQPYVKPIDSTNHVKDTTTV